MKRNMFNLFIRWWVEGREEHVHLVDEVVGLREERNMFTLLMRWWV